MNEHQTGESPPHKEADLSRLKVLIAEDNLALRTINRRYVESLGVGNVYAVESAEEARKKYDALVKEKCAPNILITDVNMGGKTGTQLAEELWEEDAALQVIFMTSETEEFLRVNTRADRKFLYAGKSEIQKNPMLLEQKIKEAATRIAAQAVQR